MIARVCRLAIDPALLGAQGITDGCCLARRPAVISVGERSAGGQRHDEQREASDEHELHDGRDAGHYGRGNAA
ncbi:MAG TPA: hypothetical protein VN744_07255 [Casimicrobiaceae bacterium]|nr:hypothetical protein [Casimicrobiaceae bacterium]